MSKTCETCRWWEKWQIAPGKGVLVGGCRIRAPHNVDSDGSAVFPCTRLDDWCGEHAAKEDAA